MKKEILYATFILLSFNSLSQNKGEIKQIDKERQNLKNYAFCQCLGYSYKNQDSLFIADGSIAGYFETGGYGLSAYDAIDSIAKLYSKKIYSSKGGSNLSLMKCLDFYNSRELEKLVLELDSLIDRRKLK